MKKHYDQKAIAHSFNPGDKVLILSPTPGSALSANFSGPYVVKKKVSDTNFVIQTPDRRRRNKMCHVNMMKPYFTSEAGCGTSVVPEVKDVVTPVAVFSTVSPTDEDGLVMHNASPQGVRLKNSELLSDLSNFLAHLPNDQCGDVETLISDYPCLFNDIPSQTVITHDIILTNPTPIKQCAYLVSPAKMESMKKEVDYLVEHGFAVPSSSSWSSPCLLDQKSDGSQDSVPTSAR